MYSFTTNFPLVYNRKNMKSDITLGRDALTTISTRSNRTIQVRKAVFVVGINPIKILPLNIFSLQLLPEIGLWQLHP